MSQEPSELTYDDYKGLVESAALDFSQDPSYSALIAKAASAIIRRKESKANKNDQE